MGKLLFKVYQSILIIIYWRRFRLLSMSVKNFFLSLKDLGVISKSSSGVISIAFTKETVIKILNKIVKNFFIFLFKNYNQSNAKNDSHKV